MDRKDLPHFNILTTSEDLPPYLDNLLKNGAKEPVDFSVTLDDKPDWLNTEKFEKGQKFGLDNIVSLGFSELAATFMVWSLQPVLLPFVFAGNIITPFQAFKRYVSTMLRFRSWYEDDIWSKESNISRTNLKIVRSYHKNFHLKVQSSNREEILDKISLKKEMNPSFKFLANDMSKDFESCCPALSKIENSKFGINQMNMVLLQFTFVGLAVTYPKNFGIHSGTDEDLESYIHVWRGLGYLLGIKDEYNFCNCELDDVRKRTQDLINLVIKPSFTNLTNEWEYIMRCAVDSSEFYSAKSEFESFLLFLFEILKMNSGSLTKQTSFYQYFYFYMIKFFFGVVMRIPYFPKLLNKMLIGAAKKSQKIEREISNQIQGKHFPYVKKT